MDLINQFYNFILQGPSIHPEKTDLTVLNEGHIKAVQQNSLNTLKKLLFGSKYDKLKY